jgi:hypothetical protein
MIANRRGFRDARVIYLVSGLFATLPEHEPRSFDAASAELPEFIKEKARS